jgi:hypothetical protein
MEFHMKTYCAIAVATLVSILPAYADDRKDDDELLRRLTTLVKNKKVHTSELREMVCRLEGAACPPKDANAKLASTTKVNSGARAVIAPPDADYSIYHTLLLRDSYSPVAFITAESELSQKGATFSFTDNIRDRQTTFVGKGALMLASYGNLDANVSSLPITHFAWVPGVEWDRKIINGKDTGSMTARAGLELETVGDRPFPTQYWRATAIYTTDVNTKAQIYGVEGSWQPESTPLWLNVTRRLFLDSPAWLGFYPSLNVDYYSTQKVGEFKNLQARDYLWLGPKFSATLSFDQDYFLNPFTFYLNYQYGYDALSSSSNSSSSYLQTGALIKIASLPAMALSNGGEISIDTRYTTGSKPRTLEKINEWYAGLNLKIGSIARK